MNALMWSVSVIGALAFAVNLLPMVLHTAKSRSADGVTYPFIALAYTGNICSAAFVFYSNWISGFWQYPLYFNYGTALILTAILHALKIHYGR